MMGTTMMLSILLLAVAATINIAAGDDCSDVKDKQSCGNSYHTIFIPSMMIKLINADLSRMICRVAEHELSGL